MEREAEERRRSRIFQEELTYFAEHLDERIELREAAVAKRLEEISATPSDSTDADFNDEALSVYVKALTELKNVEETITGSLDIVLAANTARIIANELGNLSGQTYSSDLLEQLFSRFCVGK